jgi:hypothetical protein
MIAIRCYILIQVTSYSFEILGPSLDESRADHWKQQNPSIREVCDVRLLETLTQEN